uniref:SH2 domain-containing protein n=1 Tax=Plectus sambesii TaxID=2011161 RepID=A0A914UVS4_9BILA
MDYSAAFFPTYSIHLLKRILAENPYALHQWLPTLLKDLEDTVINLKGRKEQIFNDKQQFTNLQKFCQIGENNERTVATSLQQLTLSSLLVSVQPSPIVQKEKSIETEVRLLIDAAIASPTAVSLPVVLITHGKQMADALSTIIWDRAFGDTKQVDWSSLADLLKKTFAYVTGSAKRTLTDQDLQYLRGKLNSNGYTYSYAQFAKDKIDPEGKFTFWTYFYSICDVIEKKLLQYWDKGYIMGFSSKEDASRKLSELDKPAFLLRFSDSQLGTLAVIYIKSPATGVTHFLLPAVQPEKTYTVVALLREFKHLQYIRYLCKENNEPIDKGRFFDDKDLVADDTAENKKVGGYRKVRLAITFDDNDEGEVESVIDGRRTTGEQEIASPIGSLDQASSNHCSCAWSSHFYSSTNSTASQLSTSENSPDFYDSLETPTLSQHDFRFSQSA